jgi:flagellar secretion chaperone FliS
MTYASRAANSYLQTQVKSSSPLELVVMLYDGALRATAAATDAFARRDIPARRVAMSKAMAIVGELQGTLDMDKGGAISVELDRLYTWMTDRLIDATVQQSPVPVEEVRKALATLREGWHEVATRARAPESAA